MGRTEGCSGADVEGVIREEVVVVPREAWRSMLGDDEEGSSREVEEGRWGGGDGRSSFIYCDCWRHQLHQNVNVFNTNWL